MTTLLSQPAFSLYAICSAVLVVSLYAIGFWTAKVRNDRKAIVNPEDVKVNSGASVVDVEHPDVQRLKRAHTNAIENAVPFFVIAFLYTQTSPSMTVARALFFTFVAIRLLHAIFYATAKQPFRTLAFTVGAIVNLAMVVQVLRAVF
jgi:uncharacterized MAPEG superfamily protein